HQFTTKTGIVNRPNAFKSVYKSNQPGPTIAFLAEYDALPGIGHGCGHNLIGTMSVGAAVILSKLIDRIGGTIIVLGTPAEETNGAMVTKAESGIFDEMEVAMIVQPSAASHENGKSLAIDAIQFAY